MYHKHNTRGVVLTGGEEGLDNKRVNIFTEELGLIWVKVQSGRIVTSRLRVSTQNFSYGNFSLIHSKTGWKLVGAQAQKNYFEQNRRSRIKARALAQVTLLLRRLLSGEDGDPELFEEVLGFLEALENTHDSQISILECFILLKIFNKLGFLRADPQVTEYLCTTYNKQTLEELSKIRNKLIKLINESLKAAGVSS